MDLYDVAVARKLSSGGGGGGGSSDFSTAEVTIVDNTGDNIHLYNIAYIAGFGDGAIAAQGLSGRPPQPKLVVLYKGQCEGYFDDGEFTVAVSGDANYDAGGNSITITGDCTITIS